MPALLSHPAHLLDRPWAARLTALSSSALVLVFGFFPLSTHLTQNLLDDVATFGFVPNGGRLYYLNRSQPPLLSEMVLALLEHDPHGIGAWVPCV